MQRITNKLIDKTLDFCLNKYGLSKFKKELPFVEVIREKSDFFGWYDVDENTIYLNKVNLLDDNEYAITFIHEYQHYLQSPTWNTRYDRKFTYTKHPYEKKAESVAVNDAEKLISYLESFKKHVLHKEVNRG